VAIVGDDHLLLDLLGDDRTSGWWPNPLTRPSTPPPLGTTAGA